MIQQLIYSIATTSPEYYEKFEIITRGPKVNTTINYISIDITRSCQVMPYFSTSATFIVDG